MNFLELCQELVREAGISGSLASVEGQTGEMLRAVNWVRKAYVDIQNEHSDWNFMRADAIFDVDTLNVTYTAAALGVAGFGEWRFIGNDWRAYSKDLGVIDEQELIFLPYDHFRRVYDRGQNRIMTGRPQYITERPDQSLQIWPKPDQFYTVVGEHYREPVRMSASEDVPLFKARFHDVIVYRALMYYGQFEGDATVHAAGQAECNRILKMMNSFYLPDIEQGSAMA